MAVILPYADWLEPELRAAIKTLEKRIGSAVASVSHNGETVTYRGPTEIRLALAEMRLALARLVDPENAPRQRATMTVFYPRFTRGF